ncbi:hypothetical protein L7750_14660 [Xenorhabdus bovienii]|uniref:Uncharacterized protein n=4 Tax=Xenorhabdus TaxID=626 RepID=A0A077ND04_XENBV|nr:MULTISPECIES: hypothetical protein [Xenorhabdus]MCG3471594.1 hypothetical protein [Xenorhabdus bovienii]MDC9623275.1 hypothetical protein [Xenorhabdus aichiensis]CDG96233.1 hypothetical protein XBP1_1980025 [Xenorhabdus bovienii str. puntauvense]CDG99735.1 hypothetical protein XBFM1_1170002 [Xenorhabdus bovienii str. feltiae Moldova]CDH23956.1 hypothetical protein XBKB1_2240002 [Xenorhabdus bovienii str. kraussei Becker Underwood]
MGNFISRKFRQGQQLRLFPRSLRRDEGCIEEHDEEVCARDQWVSNRIHRHCEYAPENALTNLHKTYADRGKIINYNCLDAFNTKRDPVGKGRRLAMQQPHAQLDEIYILERTHCQLQGDGDAHYFMKSIEPITLHVPDGHYLYVIYTDMPLTVICGLYDPNRIPTIGHTSLIKGRIRLYGKNKNISQLDDKDIDYAKYPVLLAGELFFDDGRLTMWNNRSGHYFPKGDKVVLNATNCILPQKLFRQVWG